MSTKSLLVMPDGFDESESEIELKGWISGVVLTIEGKRHSLTFYDPVRLAQEIGDQLRRSSIFFEPNLVVVESVTRSAMQSAAESLVATGQLTNLVSLANGR
jgi:hypothetical protein